MVKRFLGFVEKHGLINESERVLLAVSGGLDSVVMTHFFKEGGFDFGMAHCNFCLRGEESNKDAVFVERLAKKMNVQFHLKHFDTAGIASERGVSIQMAARDLRYQWFDELSTWFGYDKVAVAHHLDDNIETVIYNMVRGTSIAGLRGILPLSRGNLIRPLLEFERTELMAYAQKNQIQWREDSSNESVVYKRNYIRHEITPKLSELNPDFRKVMHDSMEKNREVEKVFMDNMEKLRTEALRREGAEFYISKKIIEEKNIGPYVLFHLIGLFGFNYQQCKDVLGAIDLQAGKRFESPSHQLLIDRDRLIIYENRDEKLADGNLVELSIGKNNLSGILVNVEMIVGDGEVKIDPSPNVACLDADKLTFPLKWRRWQQGDWFVPLGMQGKKKLSDFMIDKKIPLNLKTGIMVVLSGQDIVWVAGQRIDERFKITSHSERVLRISWCRNN